MSSTTAAGKRRRNLAIGSYQVIGTPLGKGGMGTVYQVRDPKGHAFAIKEFSPLLTKDRRMRARFRQEHEILRTLAHPNVVKVGDLFEANGTLNMRLELLEGPNLKQILRRERQLPSGLVYAIGARVAFALAHAHSRGILHRDIKPENIVITVQGRVKLTDFGVARLGQGGITVTGSVIGTPDYLSPEQLSGAGKLTNASDIFSLGVVLYQLLEGRLPYPKAGNTAPAELAKKRAARAPRYPSRVPDSDIAALVLRCLDPVADKRPRSAKELAKAFSRLEDVMAERKMAKMVCTISERRREIKDEPALISIPTSKIRRLAETLLGATALACLGWLGTRWLLGEGGLKELVQWFRGLLQAIFWGMLGE